MGRIGSNPITCAIIIRPTIERHQMLFIVLPLLIVTIFCCWAAIEHDGGLVFAGLAIAFGVGFIIAIVGSAAYHNEVVYSKPITGPVQGITNPNEGTVYQFKVGNKTVAMDSGGDNVTILVDGQDRLVRKEHATYSWLVPWHNVDTDFYDLHVTTVSAP